MLSTIDLSVQLEREEYEKKLPALQVQLRELHFEAFQKRIPAIFMFEGWDASGKGGAIKRLTQVLDPRGYSVVPIAAPQGDERQHHYLWRFWKHMPKAGHFTVFDRSWYGRVMVARDHRVRAPARRLRNGGGEVLPSHRQEGAAQTLR